MARSRNIKPGFFRNDRLAKLSFGCRLLLIGLSTIADRAGRLEDRPKRIAAEIFPYNRSAPVEKWLGLLAAGDDPFIIRYQIGSARYILIPTWGQDQNPHIKEPESTIPAPYEHGTTPAEAGNVPEPARLDSLIPDSLIPDSPKPVPAASHLSPPEQIQRKNTHPKKQISEWHHESHFLAAWERHHKNRGRTETQQIVLQILMGREIDWNELERRHVPYCEYWSRNGWSFCGMTLLEWIDNGMPEAPPNAENLAVQTREIVLCPTCHGRPCFCAEIAAEKSTHEDHITTH